MSDILVINGPNLNLLGSREPNIYGVETLDSINKKLKKIANSNNVNIDFFQSNVEGFIIDKIHQNNYKFIIINPGAYTHTSIAIRDALSAIAKPFIEIHLSNIYNREGFRKHSYLSDIAYGCIFGFGARGYELALLEAINYIK